MFDVHDPSFIYLVCYFTFGVIPPVLTDVILDLRSFLGANVIPTASCKVRNHRDLTRNKKEWMNTIFPLDLIKWCGKDSRLKVSQPDKRPFCESMEGSR